MDRRLRLEHAYHNESVCHYIDNNGSFPDWVITTAFYASLHFVSYKLFPMTVNDNGKITIHNTLEQYKKAYRNSSDKHTILSDLVYSNYPNISTEYDELLGYCKTARYVHYKTKQWKCKRAIEIVNHIKIGLGFPNTLPDGLI